MAYEAAPLPMTISDSTPAVGASTTITLKGGATLAGDTVLLTVNSPVITVSGVADANGTVTCTFTPTVTGAHSAVATVADGSIVGSALAFTVVAAGSSPSDIKGAALSDTGFDGMGLAAGAGALLLAGAGAVFIAKRRQTARIPG